MSELSLSEVDSDTVAQDAQALLDRQTQVLDLIAGAAPLREVLALILVSLEQLMQGACCSILLIDRAHGSLHHGAAPSLPPEYVAAIDGMTIADGAGSCGTAAARNVAVVAPDVRTDPRWAAYRHLAEPAGLRSCWSTPIPGRDGRPVGTFAVYHRRPHHPSLREQSLVDRFTHLAAVAIEHAGLVGDLMESEERFRTSFDDNSLGMAILGLDRRVVTSNLALGGLVGGGRDLIGSTLADLVAARPISPGSWLDRLDHPGAAPVSFAAALRRPDREDLDVEVTVALLIGRDGLPSQYVVNVLDLTERRAAERDRRARLEAETARRTAEELAHARSELLAAVGHEARTPLQTIVGFAELLGTLDLDESRRREALEHVGAAAGHVMDLLTDVLDLSRIEASALPLTPEPIRVADLVTEVFGLLAPQAQQRDVRVSLDLGREVALADPRRLLQVFLNLVGNAIRHGAAGGRVVVRGHPTPDGTHLLLFVDDDGPGISPEVLPRIFTPFPRAGLRDSPAAAREPGGPAYGESIGLGLGLAHGLMRAMSGDLSVAHSGPSGTSMRLRIPRGRRPGPLVPGNTEKGNHP
ncbi:GAF domain-containing sensor histidine kinase [Allobranchiibius sp. CTAmp26]|uniref:GAF domain-containing sensor histidine kinase n=1 Tax=Allobranchiibius sp. CTAmp26 TaxID=2815214 RepID=UPI001AA0FCB9|nr:GAF domain-containing sensor histidine kinase [Allobranchiibius sp. CTAmp26]MBO1755727.1 GAF domain-containing sensor histidine kinase [Allobranchiibius sp. CTAmp26]